MKRCQKCIMPEVKPHCVVDTNGICTICAKHNESISIVKEKDIPPETRNNGLEELLAAVNANKNKESIYDCIVSVSGGKDSLMTLYIAKKKLNLNCLAVFIDNGFGCDEMYHNVRTASEKWGVDLIVFKSSLFKKLFKFLLQAKKTVYYCRLCHALLDKQIRDIAVQHNVPLILGGYTKGQDFVKHLELYWIYKISDKTVCDLLASQPEYSGLVRMFKNPSIYFYQNYSKIKLVSPFWYIAWDEEEIVDILAKELNFKRPIDSWPPDSTNCTFNYVSQFLARKDFGYSQHEVELSTLVRTGEMNRPRALELIEAPITEEHLTRVLNKMDLALSDIL